ATWAGLSSYSCGPTLSSALTATRLPSWAARSSDSPQPTAARNPARNASPAPARAAPRTSATRPPLRAASHPRPTPPPPRPRAGRAEGRHPHADLRQHLGARPAGLALDERFLVLVAEQVPCPGHQRPHVRSVQPRELLRGVGGEGDAQAEALRGVGEHRLGV